MHSDGTIGNRHLLAVFCRALLIQASWSFERMQSLGFAYAIEPVLKKLYSDQAEYVSRLKLHMEYFNTQPYLASFILGATIRLEQDRASGHNTETDIAVLKASLMAPLGALGDSFFWGALKPLAAVIAVALLMIGFWWAPFLFLAIYNAGHLTIRVLALYWGYATGGDAVNLIDRCRFTRLAKRFKVLSLSALGGMLGSLPVWHPIFKPVVSVPDFILALSGLLATLLLIVLLRQGGTPVKLMLGLAACCLILSYTGVI